MEFKRQPAQMTPEQVRVCEQKYYDGQDGMIRRIAFESMAKSGAELIEAVSSDPEFAASALELYDAAREYAGRLRHLAGLIESAGTRLMVASAAEVAPADREAAVLSEQLAYWLTSGPPRFPVKAVANA